MVGSNSRQSLVTAVSIKRPLTPGFKVLLTLVAILAIAAAGVAWHSEKQHRRAKQAVKTLTAEQAELTQLMATLRAEVSVSKQMLKLQQDRLDSLLAQGPEVRERWLISRVADSVAVAEQALVVSHDAAQAQQALLAADRLLANQGAPRLMPLRRALQQDLSVLSGLPRVDVAGIYLRLQNLDRRITTLALPREAGRLQGAAAATSVREPVDQPADNLWQQGLAKFRALIVIRQYDAPLQPLLDASRLQLLRDQLSLLINQTELALLKGDGVVYRASLETLSLRIQQQLSSLPSSTLVPLLDELAALQALQVQLAYPALSTRAALDALMQTSETRL